MTSSGQTFSGVLCALGAGLAWGLVFVTPIWLPDYPPAWLSAGRYLAFGFIATAIAAWQLTELRTLTREDWVEAAKLSFVGNLLYYACLSAALQKAGVPMPTMLIGTLPVIIAVVSNLREHTVQWKSLRWPLGLIAAGLMLVNTEEWAHLSVETRTHYLSGGLLAMGAVACWTWYPIRNARWMRLRGGALSASTWATAQGIVTLPMAGLWMSYLLYSSNAVPSNNDLLLGPRPLHFVGLMLTLGLLASWLGTRLWNAAGQRLPTVLLGQLIVFETLSALLYGYLVQASWPSSYASLGIILLILGVLSGSRTIRS